MREFDSPPGLKKLTYGKFWGESKDGVSLGWDPSARPVIVLYELKRNIKQNRCTDSVRITKFIIFCLGGEIGRR